MVMAMKGVVVVVVVCSGGLKTTRAPIGGRPSKQVQFSLPASTPATAAPSTGGKEIGRASCRERVSSPV